MPRKQKNLNIVDLANDLEEAVIQDLATRHEARVAVLTEKAVNFTGAVPSAAATESVANAWERMKELYALGDDGGPGLTMGDLAEYMKLEAVVDRFLTDYPSTAAGAREGLSNPFDKTGPRAYVENRPLAEGQTFSGAVRALNLDARDEIAGDPDLLERGAFTDTIRNAMSGMGVSSFSEVRNAMSGGTGGAGGFLLPTILSADLIDLARPHARVLQAGARVVPMANREVDVPKWTQDPEPEWRGENDAIAEDDGGLDKLTLTAKGLAVVTKVSRELIEDTDLEVDLKAAFAKSFALVLDKAALYADGTGDKPTGLKSTAGVTKTPLAANGATPADWDPFVESVGRLRDVNENPNAQLMSDRTARKLGMLKETGSGAYLRPPEYLDEVARYTTGQIPNNLVVGTSGATTSDVFTGDWSQLYIGVRTALQITMLDQRYMVDAGQYGFVAWWRGDVQVARPGAFDIVTGIKP